MAKIIANRLKPLLHGLIGPDQAGFMPGREAKGNVTKSLDLIYAAHTQIIEGLLLSMDAEKAFDRVAWDFMLETCRFIGLANSSIQGFKMTKKEYKVTTYADDLLFFLTNPHISIPLSLKEFSLYGYISNLKINYAKSEAMNVTIPDNKLKTVQKRTAPLNGNLQPLNT